jgi:hypothetical protein
MSADAAKSILVSAAPGQFDTVLDNVQKLAKDTLKGNWADEIKAQIDKKKCIGLNENVSHPLALSLKEKLKVYQEDAFGSKAGVSARIAISPGDESYQIVVSTYAEKIDTSNQYTGAWKATWVVGAEDDTMAEICGSVSLHTFSYEDGNIQLRTEREFEAMEVSAGEDGLAKAVVDQITKWEHEVLSLLAAMHDFVGDNLRDIRRILPITKTKMKWDVVAHRNVKTLHATKPKKK